MSDVTNENVIPEVTNEVPDVIPNSVKTIAEPVLESDSNSRNREKRPFSNHSYTIDYVAGISQSTIKKALYDRVEFNASISKFIKESEFYRLLEYVDDLNRLNEFDSIWLNKPLKEIKISKLVKSLLLPLSVRLKAGDTSWEDYLVRPTFQIKNGSYQEFDELMNALNHSFRIQDEMEAYLRENVSLVTILDETSFNGLCSHKETTFYPVPIDIDCSSARNNIYIDNSAEILNFYWRDTVQSKVVKK